MAATHYLANYLRSKNYIGDLKEVRIKKIDLNNAKIALKADQDAFFLNAIITFAACINSLKKENYSWAFIQSYYCLFYLAESLIADKDYAVFYMDSKPYKIRLLDGELFSKPKGNNSHEVVLNIFKDVYSSDPMLSSTINEENPIDWFRKKREFINYKQTPYSDPVPPLKLYRYFSNIRNWFHIYLNDSTNIYSFSEEHSYIAYPLNLIIRELDKYENETRINPLLTSDKLFFLRENLADDKGPFSAIFTQLKKIKALT